MTKKELLDAVRNKIDEIDEDTQIDNIIETAFDYAYKRDLGKLDKRLSSAYIPVVNGLATLPDDYLTLEQVTPVLLDSERVVGNSIISARSITFNIIYSVLRASLSDTDVLDMDESLQYLIVLYCCMAYYEYKKRTETVNMYYNEYELKKKDYISDNTNYIEEGTLDIYTMESDEDD